jgi:excalibur calcium-binding domain-containing protein
MSPTRRTRLSMFAAAVSGALVLAMAGTAMATEESVPPADSLLSHSSEDGSEEPDDEAGVPATTPASAPDDDDADDDRDCPDFATQAAAQAALAESPGDREQLDADDDGIACEQHFGTEGQQVAVYPQGGVATGGADRP